MNIDILPPPVREKFKTERDFQDALKEWNKTFKKFSPKK